MVHGQPSRGRGGRSGSNKSYASFSNSSESTSSPTKFNIQGLSMDEVKSIRFINQLESSSNTLPFAPAHFANSGIMQNQLGVVTSNLWISQGLLII